MPRLSHGYATLAPSQVPRHSSVSLSAVRRISMRKFAARARRARYKLAIGLRTSVFDWPEWSWKVVSAHGASAPSLHRSFGLSPTQFLPNVIHQVLLTGLARVIDPLAQAALHRVGLAPFPVSEPGLAFIRCVKSHAASQMSVGNVGPNGHASVRTVGSVRPGPGAAGPYKCGRGSAARIAIAAMDARASIPDSGYRNRAQRRGPAKANSGSRMPDPEAKPRAE